MRWTRWTVPNQPGCIRTKVGPAGLSKHSFSQVRDSTPLLKTELPKGRTLRHFRVQAYTGNGGGSSVLPLERSQGALQVSLQDGRIQPT